MTDQELLTSIHNLIQQEMKQQENRMIDSVKVLLQANDSKLETIIEGQKGLVESYKLLEKQVSKLDTVEDRLSVFEGVVRLHSEDISELKQEIQKLKKAE